MKKSFYFFMVLASAVLFITACDKDEDEPQFVTITLGAQDNSSAKGFYSVEGNKTYTLDEAFQYQDMIDIFCFYEVEGGNNIAMASPGTGITGIFTGSGSLENWTTTDTTFFCTTGLTPEQFDALENTDELIQTSFIEDDARKKAKDLKVDDVYSIKIQSGKYGLFKVTAVTQGANGSVSIELKMKK